MKGFFSELRLYICNHLVAHIPSHFIRLAFYRYIMGFQLEKGVAIHLGGRFDCAQGLTIGTNSVVNENCRLDPRGGVKIGSNVSISSEVIILTGDHDLKASDFRGRSRPVIIEDYVFIGTRVMILPGVTLRRGAVIAAGAVVNRDVKSLDVVGGVPARSIGTRNPELGYSAEYVRWFH